MLYVFLLFSLCLWFLCFLLVYVLCVLVLFVVVCRCCCCCRLCVDVVCCYFVEEAGVVTCTSDRSPIVALLSIRFFQIESW